MTTSLPFKLALPDTCEVRFVLQHFLYCNPEKHCAIGHAYSTSLVYPMDTKFFAMGYWRVRQYLDDNHIPLSQIGLTLNTSQILRDTSGKISLIGANNLSLLIIGNDFVYTSKQFIRKIFSRFYDNDSLLISLR